MITVHLSGSDWSYPKIPSSVNKEFENADMRDQKVKNAFKEMVDAGFVNVNCVMEDSQSPKFSDTRYTHPYTYNNNGDVERFVYDDSFANEHEMATA